ncbi:MAG: adenosylcobalamin-dependent ribonucleoside-diphosphate reductase [Candidatus Obscuribacterales bacterium]|nr:adenosylcobalamin-dependent ribonucleoside-diphosphate reductase [Candidatus Obscuribacterales bacterium]
MFSTNALRVLQKRYLLRDKEGKLGETPEGMVARVASAVAVAEKKWNAEPALIASVEDDFYQMMLSCRFIPNSPTLMNAGREKGQLSACFVLPVPDNLEGIFETCKHAALIHKTGGGTGFSFSRLRPANDPVASSIGVASGPVSFMSVYDAATEAIRQGGTRRGANMGILRVDHPDIEAFICCKADTDKLNNFNISVAVTDRFMEALEKDEDYDLVHPVSKVSISRISARYIFDLIVKNAHATGEPGVVFLDRINQSDPVLSGYDTEGNIIAGTEEIEATNPCGEQPLGPGDACNLGSINLSLFVDQEKRSFKWDELKKTIHTSVRFLDNVIEINNYPLPFIASATLNNRRIGLGVMGWAEALILLGIAYNSQQAIDQADECMSFFQKEAHQASLALGVERGVFPNWRFSIWGSGEPSVKGQAPMRNATVTTIAPTGTISIIAGTSSGIEPLFAVSYVRRVLGGEELIEVNPLFEEIARQRGFYSEALMKEIAEVGTLSSIDSVPADIRRLFVSSHEIDYRWHIEMQAAFQRHTDNAVSKTINFPGQASIEEVESAYRLAWKLGLKGITVYRDTSRASQVLNIASTDPLAKEQKKRREAGRADFAGTAISESIEIEHIEHEEELVVRAGSGKALSGCAIREKTSFMGASPCPECGHSSRSLMKYEACLRCRYCGYTKC